MVSPEISDDWEKAVDEFMSDAKTPKLASRDFEHTSPLPPAKIQSGHRDLPVGAARCYACNAATFGRSQDGWTPLCDSCASI